MQYIIEWIISYWVYQTLLNKFVWGKPGIHTFFNRKEC